MPLISSYTSEGLQGLVTFTPSDLLLSLEIEQPRIAVILGILLISLLAVSFPGVSKQIPFLRIPHLVFFIGKHFGTGAILSTAFCHLLPDAFESLHDPEVNDRYNGIGRWTGMIILSSLLLIFLVEYISTSYVDHLHAGPSTPSSPFSSRAPSRPKTPTINTTSPTPHPRLNNPTSVILPSKPPGSSSQITNPCSSANCSTLAATESTPLIRKPNRTKSLHSFDHHRDDALLSLILLNSPRLSRGGLPHSGLLWGRDVACVCHKGRATLAPACEVNRSNLTEDGSEDEQEDVKPKIGRKRQIVGILILQLGIMIHSLVIGLTLAITSGTEFTSLVTAIIFHQLFEGLSLGIRIASLPPASLPLPESSLPSRSSPPPLGTLSESSDDLPSDTTRGSRTWTFRWLEPTLSILFAITTPLGMGLGTLVFVRPHAGTSPAQAARMGLVQGLMSGISAGMLIYAATVEMLAGDFVFGDVGGDHGHSHGHSHGHDDSNEHIHDKSKLGPGWRKVLAVISLLAGSVAMALIGLVE